MADNKSTDSLAATLTPPPAEVFEADSSKVKAGDGEVVVTSPAGTKSVVEKHHVDALKAQGYKVGS